MIKGLSSREDSALIGFVSVCLGFGAIKISEAHRWVYYMIETNDELPPYMYYLMNAQNCLEFERLIGFPVYTKFKHDEYRACSGIAWARGNLDPELGHAFSQKAGLNALKRNPHIAKRFQEVFPFLHFEPPG